MLWCSIYIFESWPCFAGLILGCSSGLMSMFGGGHVYIHVVPGCSKLTLRRVNGCGMILVSDPAPGFDCAWVVLLGIEMYC